MLPIIKLEKSATIIILLLLFLLLTNYQSANEFMNFKTHLCFLT